MAPTQRKGSLSERNEIEIPVQTDEIQETEGPKKGVYHDLFQKAGKWNICFLPKHYSDHSKMIEDFNVRDEDVWVVSFIKAGELYNTTHY